MFSKNIYKYILLISNTLLANFVRSNKANIFTECLNPGNIALTFDDGPNIETTPIVLDILKKNNIKGTFFINSHNWSNLDKNPEAVELIKYIYE